MTLVRWALIRHLVAAIVAVVVSIAVAAVVAYLLARDQVHDAAEHDAVLRATAVVAPFTVDDLHTDPSSARQVLDDELRPHLADGSLVRVKIWARSGPSSGRIVYSDESRLEGEEYPISDEVAALFGTRGASSHTVPDDDGEHRFEAAQADALVEVYVGFADRGATPLLFEAYVPVEGLGAALRMSLAHVVPPALIGIVALSALLLPLSVALARRVATAEGERGRLLRRALAVSDDERRVLAERLHDNVLPGLAGVGVALEADDHPAAKVVQDDIAALRRLVSELYPPGLDAATLVPNLRALDRLVPGTEVVVIAPERLDVDADTAWLVFRCVRELVRNAVGHGAATRVEVEVGDDAAGLRVRVADDGSGFDPAAVDPNRHFGLRMITRGVADSGGAVDVRSGPGWGTTVVFDLPPG